MVGIATTLIDQGSWYAVFQDIHDDKGLRGAIDSMLKAQDDDQQAKLIDQVYQLNTKRNSLTGKRAVMMNCFLYAYSPERNLAIVSLKDRELLLNYLGFGDEGLASRSIGQKVVETRRKLLEFKEQLGSDIGTWEYSKFLYIEPLKSVWKPSEEEGGAGQGDQGQGEGKKAGPTWWIEKTTLIGHQLTQPGLPETTFGKSLWSPQKVGNQRRWEKMTKVVSQDIIIHLNQDRSVNTFLGVSKAKASYTTFTIPPGTDWTRSGPMDGYHVDLDGYIQLAPSIRWADLRGAKEIGLKDVYTKAEDSIFFDKNLDLNQGAYLTRAPESLVATINEYYKSVSGQSLPFYSGSPTMTTPTDPIAGKIIEALETASQVILYGPPGTGKTYAAIKFVENISDAKKMFISFHPSYSYEEFIEGIRPRTTSSGVLAFGVEDGKFKAFCMDAYNHLLASAGIQKTWDASNPLPTLSPEEKPKVLAEVVKDQNKFYLIIDEINRGDISKIFGELITLIETDKRLTRENEIVVPLTYSPKSSKFGVPPNLFIIGTMNTADRSIALIDVALRRRFRFVELLPDHAILRQELLSIPSDIADAVVRSLEGLNYRLRVKYDRNHQIGHAYFIKLKSHTQRPDAIRALKQIWWYEVIPLLQEYFYNNGRKFYEALKENPTLFEEPPSDKNNFTFVLKDPEGVSETDFLGFLGAVAQSP